MYKNIRTYDVRYTDVDFKTELRLSSLLSLLGESTCYSADELGFGYDVITPLNIGFILINWYIETLRPIKLGEKLTIHTWPMRPQNIIVLREFEMFVGDEKVGAATTRWCLVDLTKFSVLPISSFLQNDTREYNDFRAIDFNSWSLPNLENAAKKYEKIIRVSDYDYYDHVNNTKYADMCIDAFSLDELSERPIENILIHYVRQCKYGEKIVFFRKDEGDFSFVEGRVNDEIRVKFKIKFRKRL